MSAGEAGKCKCGKASVAGECARCSWARIEALMDGKVATPMKRPAAKKMKAPAAGSCTYCHAELTVFSHKSITHLGTECGKCMKVLLAARENRKADRSGGRSGGADGLIKAMGWLVANE